MAAGGRRADSALARRERTLEFMRAIWALDHALHRTSKRMAITIGVTGPQRLVLRLLGRRPASTAGDLARVLHLHPSTVTGVLARLQEHGLIHRAADRADRRRASLALTAKGKRFDRLTGGTIEGAIERALSRAAARDAEATVRTLGAVAEALRQTCDEPRRRIR
jgi:DNA-binding MarR family transcriptional regulator